MRRRRVTGGEERDERRERETERRGGERNDNTNDQPSDESGRTKRLEGETVEERDDARTTSWSHPSDSRIPLLRRTLARSTRPLIALTSS
jgi:hypothetical protein